MATQKFQDYFLEPTTGKWIEVVGSAKMIHQGPRGTSVSDKQAHWTRALGAPMASSQAVAIISRTLGRTEEPLRIALKVLLNAERVDARLVYWVDFEDRLIVVDAVDGELIHDISKHRAFAKVPEIKVYSAKGLRHRCALLCGKA